MYLYGVTDFNWMLISCYKSYLLHRTEGQGALIIFLLESAYNLRILQFLLVTSITCYRLFLLVPEQSSPELQSCAAVPRH
jgi:hypothetical protein